MNKRKRKEGSIRCYTVVIRELAVAHTLSSNSISNYFSFILTDIICVSRN